MGILFYGVIAFVLSALLLTKYLGRAGKIRQETFKELNARVLSWIVMILVVSGSLYIGEKTTIVLFTMISFFVLREFLSITPVIISDYWPLFATFYIVLPIQYALVAMHYYGLFAIMIPVYSFMFLPTLTSIVGEPRDFLGRVAKIQWAQMIGIYNISYIPALFMLNGIHGINSIGLIIFLLIVVQFSDVAQYVFGKLFGKHKIAPKMSPNKTVEGLIGGGISAILLGMGLNWLTPFGVVNAGLLSSLLVIAGFFGGLSLSGVKRSLGTKDWGKSIPGHGGFMDRMDGLTFAAPVFFHVIRFFWG